MLDRAAVVAFQSDLPDLKSLLATLTSTPPRWKRRHWVLAIWHSRPPGTVERPFMPGERRPRRRCLRKPAPGKTVPLRGVYYDPVGIVAPFDGSAMMRPDKTTVVAGIFVHNMASGANNFTMQWVTTTSLTGDAPYDSNGDFKPDSSLSLSLLDCKSVAIP